MQPSALSAEARSPAVGVLGDKKRRSARPDAARRSTMSGSLSPSRREQRNRWSRRRAHGPAARPPSALTTQAAGATAQPGEPAHHSSADQALGGTGPARPKRLRRSHAARVRPLAIPSPEACHANPEAPNPVAATPATSQVRTWLVCWPRYPAASVSHIICPDLASLGSGRLV